MNGHEEELSQGEIQLCCVLQGLWDRVGQASAPAWFMPLGLEKSILTSEFWALS